MAIDTRTVWYENIAPGVTMASLTHILSTYAASAEGTGDGTDKNTVHSYAAVYERLFEPIRESVQHVVELGVDSGASLAAWATYFPNARVTGLDLTLSNVTHAHPRVDVRQGDATQPVPPGLGSIDVVIDDASHRQEDQLAALAVWGPRVTRMMVIEDVAASTHEAFAHLATKLGLSMETYDLRAQTGRFDDVLLVFRPATAERSRA